MKNCEYFHCFNSTNTFTSICESAKVVIDSKNQLSDTYELNTLLYAVFKYFAML